VARLAVRSLNDPVLPGPFDRLGLPIHRRRRQHEPRGGIGTGRGITTTLPMPGRWTDAAPAWASPAASAVPAGFSPSKTRKAGLNAENRRFYFMHNLDQDPMVPDPDTVLDGGITLSFRARLTPPKPTDPLTELAAAPDGAVNSGDGRGMIGLRQSGGAGMILSFSLNRAVEDTGPGTTFNLGQGRFCT